MALGRVPLVDSLLAQGRLVAPFRNRYATTRAYFIVRGTVSALRPEAQAFIDWLIEEAAAESDADGGEAKPARKRTGQAMTGATTHAPLTAPSRWIARFAPLIPPGARVLDVACGQGRHARSWRQRLCDVVAIDRDLQALAALAGVPRVTTIAADLEGDSWPLSGERFDAIVVANYLHRPLFPKLLDALAGDGALAVRDIRGRQRGLRTTVQS